jgi:SlyX protein
MVTTEQDPPGLEAIECKLAHLERALQELNDCVVRQQREIELLTARHRGLQAQLTALEAGPEMAAGFETPPHY